MTPYYQDDRVTLYCGDSLEILPMLEAGSVDAVITDPPYGVQFDRATWNDDPSLYGDFMRSWLAVAKDIAPAFFVWQALRNCNRWHEWFPPSFRILAAVKGFVQYRPTPVQWSWDPVIFWGDIKSKPSVYRKDWHLQSLAPFGAGRERIPHPCPRPLEATRYVVELAAGQVVLDPFMGSGTTGVACVQTGRRFIGIEIEEKYCEIAAKRIQDAEAQGALEVSA